jgi:hypothetical protein
MRRRPLRPWDGRGCAWCQSGPTTSWICSPCIGVRERWVMRRTAVVNQIRGLSDVCRRLDAIPGIGPLTATALIAAIGYGAAFRKGREFAACIGLAWRSSMMPSAYVTDRDVMSMAVSLERDSAATYSNSRGSQIMTCLRPIVWRGTGGRTSRIRMRVPFWKRTDRSDFIPSNGL